MHYYSLNHKAPDVSFAEAVIKGLAPDRGLYFPKQITPLPSEFFDQIEKFSNVDIAYTAIRQFVGDAIPEDALKEILVDVLDFEFPVVEISEQISTLELFHGPTMAFKDVGARFMALCLQYFGRAQKREVTVLVATSGDTGGAVANGFLGVAGVNVVILYPKGAVSDIQERQLTTLGNNITALRIEGMFDDCQNLVKTAFLDPELTKHRQLTSANSINIARWLPQLFYFLFAYKQIKNKGKKMVFSVPSGNFGNICAGIVAKKLGLPIDHFIASVNSNDTVTRYLNTEKYEPRPSQKTISNAMDVSDPSNFVRIQELFGKDFTALKSQFSSYSFTDDETKDAMKRVFDTTNYVCDPHGAVGYLGLEAYKLKPDQHGIFLETAHPVKFLDVVEEVLPIKVGIPEQIEKVLHKEKKFKDINTYEAFKTFLLTPSNQ